MNRTPAFLLIAFSLTAWGCRQPAFYHPRAYERSQIDVFRALPGASEIIYRIAGGRQVAFYVAPKSHPDEVPESLWILFGGINTLALEWLPWLVHCPNQRAGFLLMEYPGYGLSEGITRAENILISSQTAFASLASYLKVEPGDLEKNLGILGHSLGTGTALQFAVQVNVKKLILVSPFTSLEELIKFRYGVFWGTFLNLINPEKYPNEKRLASLAARLHPPQITIFHGEADEVIPAWMGRKLAQLHPFVIAYHEIPGIGHSGFFDRHTLFVWKTMFPEG